MSATNAPPNPGSPKGSPRLPQKGLFARKPGAVIGGALVAGASLLYYATRPARPAEDYQKSALATTGVQNIEAAYTNAGATSTHTKAYGGTPRGDKHDENLGADGGTAKPKGFKDDGLGHDQRASRAGAPSSKANQMLYGDSKGK